MSIRNPAVAGTFYPDNPDVLSQTVNAFLAEAKKQYDFKPKALIVPHAGFMYSGAVAASAYKNLDLYSETIKRVVLLGPSHRVALRGLALPDSDFFSSPLGNVEIDRDACSTLRVYPQVKVEPVAHVLEHCLEVHLPFLQCVLHDITLVPLVVGVAKPESVAEIIEAMWGGDETLIVVSSDLSHYHKYEEARKVDAKTTSLIEELAPLLQGEQACGANAINGLLLAAQKRSLKIETIDLRNSGDTAGAKGRVVGYGAYVLH